MTTTRADHSLSRVELVVLARLSPETRPSRRTSAQARSGGKPARPKLPGDADLTRAVAELAMPDEPPAQVREAVGHALDELRRRGLIEPKRRAPTGDGDRALRAAFELDRTPSWTEVRDLHLPARALELAAGSEEARKTLDKGKTIALAILGGELRLPNTATLAQVCDALIARALGMPPGPVTLDQIRKHVLARELESDTRGTTEQLVARLATKRIPAATPDKRTMIRALGRRWLYKALPAPGNGAAQLGPRATPAQPPLPLPPSPVSSAAPAQPPLPLPPPPVSSAATTQPPLPTGLSPSPRPVAAPAAPPPLPPLPPKPATPATAALSADTLLTLVREAIPRIGSDGRFGAEKVFVSAIWERIERDGRLPELSYERFKRWLVTANRDQLLDLARADLVGAMDPKLVADSEIEHLGTTFHFVVDRRAQTPATGRGFHAR
ncbi:MAG TPA: hypothetical protein VFK02_24060 [Kofleriaceae bacterium]|nr:hypothetical protein [Kofleriaceae bacterium]